MLPVGFVIKGCWIGQVIFLEFCQSNKVLIGFCMGEVIFMSAELMMLRLITVTVSAQPQPRWKMTALNFGIKDQSQSSRYSFSGGVGVGLLPFF